MNQDVLQSPPPQEEAPRDPKKSQCPSMMAELGVLMVVAVLWSALLAPELKVVAVLSAHAHAIRRSRLLNRRAGADDVVSAQLPDSLVHLAGLRKRCFQHALGQCRNEPAPSCCACNVSRIFHWNNSSRTTPQNPTKRDEAQSGHRPVRRSGMVPPHWPSN